MMEERIKDKDKDMKVDKKSQRIILFTFVFLCIKHALPALDHIILIRLGLHP